jgi:cyclopropane fatty-acyl-phospholipid synthase-like methyltransferase
MKEMHKRFLWAHSLMDIKPADHILEVGCGAGLLLEIMAASIETGSITAVDKSASMIRQASKRNQSFIGKKKITLIEGAFTDVKLPEGKYDKIVAFNVSAFFLKDPVNELKRVRLLLKKGGQFFLFYQPAGNNHQALAEKAAVILQQHGFSTSPIIFQKMETGTAFCLILK